MGLTLDAAPATQSGYPPTCSPTPPVGGPSRSCKVHKATSASDHRHVFAEWLTERGRTTAAEAALACGTKLVGGKIFDRELSDGTYVAFADREHRWHQRVWFCGTRFCGVHGCGLAVENRDRRRALDKWEGNRVEVYGRVAAGKSRLLWVVARPPRRYEDVEEQFAYVESCFKAMLTSSPFEKCVIGGFWRAEVAGWKGPHYNLLVEVSSKRTFEREVKKVFKETASTRSDRAIKIEEVRCQGRDEVKTLLANLDTVDIEAKVPKAKETLEHHVRRIINYMTKKTPSATGLEFEDQLVEDEEAGGLQAVPAAVYRAGLNALAARQQQAWLGAWHGNSGPRAKEDRDRRRQQAQEGLEREAKRSLGYRRDLKSARSTAERARTLRKHVALQRDFDRESRRARRDSGVAGRRGRRRGPPRGSLEDRIKHGFYYSLNGNKDRAGNLLGVVEESIEVWDRPALQCSN